MANLESLLKTLDSLSLDQLSVLHEYVHKLIDSLEKKRTESSPHEDERQIVA